MSTIMTLISFNILEGFRPLEAVEAERRHLDRERAEIARNLVHNHNPDILILNEALFCREYGDRSIDYGDLFDFPFQTSALYDNEWGNAILSKFEIEHAEEMKIYNRGGLISRIATKEGPVTIASYHPHPKRFPAHKAEDFSRLVQGLEGPVILGGDFNCIHPEDPLDHDLLVSGFQRFSDHPMELLAQFVDSGRHVFSTLADRGFEDAIPPEKRRYTIPTDLISTDKSSAIRIDHILANELVEILDGEIIQDQDSNLASDHHPVKIRFNLKS